MKEVLVLPFVVAGVLSQANGAQVVINNIAVGPGDTLYANRDGTLMDGGSVHMGYFPSTVNSSDLGTVSMLLAQLGSFTAIASAVPGAYSVTLGGAFPGYAEQVEASNTGLIDYFSPLLGRTLYQIVTDAPDLESVTGASQIALLEMMKIRLDLPWEETYTSNPDGLVPIIGTIGTFSGDAGVGEGIYLTLKMGLVPELSTAILGALGAVGVLRRRRA